MTLQLCSLAACFSFASLARVFFLWPMPFYALFRGAKTFLLVFYGGRFVNNVSERVNLSCSIGLESGAFIELRDQLVNF